MKNQDNAIIGIYKITNPKDKVYIGQSSNIEKRKYYYFSIKCDKQPKIYNSICCIGKQKTAGGYIWKFKN